MWAAITASDQPIYTAVTAEEINILCSLAIGHRCLEIGSAWGYSAIMMARRGARNVTAVDYHQPDDSNCGAENSLDVMSKNLQIYGVISAVTMISEPSQIVLPRLVSSGEQFELIFIDGNHSYDSVVHDITWARRLISDKGYIACHDYGDTGIESVTKAVDDIFSGSKPDRLIGTLCIYGGN